MPSKSPAPRPRSSSRASDRRETGWTITPKTLTMLGAVVALAMFLWGPIQNVVKLNQSIETLAVAVTRLDGNLTVQSTRIAAVEQRAAEIAATATERGERMNKLEQRVGTLEARR